MSDDAQEPVTRFKTPTKATYVVTAGAVQRTFLSALLERKFMANTGSSSGFTYFPARASDPLTGEALPEWVEVGPRGTVTTFSVIRIPFEGQLLEPPYACAHIALDGADTVLLHIVGDVDVDDVRMGMRVEAVWRDEALPSLDSIRYFRPVDEPDAEFDTYKRHLGE